MVNFEDLCADVYIDNFIEPSNRWVNIKDLKSEFKRYDRKRKQVDGCNTHFIDTMKGWSCFSKLIRDGEYIPPEYLDDLAVPVACKPLSLWEQRHIKWQAVAQVLWHCKPGATNKEILETMFGDKFLFALLELEILTSVQKEGRGRSLENVIREVDPRQGCKRGRPAKVRADGQHKLMPIPGAFDSAYALNLAIETIVQILHKQGCKNVFEHPIILEYMNSSPPLLRMVIHTWIAVI